MISAILYGRNDGYGYGLDKRAALGLNALALRLTATGDEILFVDDNGDEARPTFPEALADTLTPRTRGLIRVLRVRPALHTALSPDAPRPVLEALSRNVALRRARPTNRWVLSTNADLIPVAPPGASLSEIAATLEDGFYGAPRFELPRLVWETLERADPESAARRIAWAADALRLDEVVRDPRPAVGFDAPGDFQLALRRDLLAIHGFDERMTRGWHVDANLAVRLAMRRGPVRRFPGPFRFYHCEHTSAAAEHHGGGRVEDDVARFVSKVAEAEIAAQAEVWGAPDALADRLGAPRVEEIHLDGPSDATPPGILARVISVTAPQRTGPAMPEVIYGPESYGRVPRRPAHVLPFLIDLLVHRSRTATVAWIGRDGETLALATRALTELGFAAPTVVAEAGPADWPDAAPSETGLERADLVVLAPPDAAFDPEGADAALDAFGRFVEMERAVRAKGRAPRPVVGVNVVHDDIEGVLLDMMELALAPFTTRLRHGFVRPPAARPVSWLAAVAPGPAGRRLTPEGAVAAAFGVAGHVFHGPHARLAPGPCRLRVRLSVSRPSHGPGAAIAAALRGLRRRDSSPPLVLEAALGARYLAQRGVSAAEAAAGAATLDFVAPPEALRPVGPGVEARLWTDGTLPLTVEGIEVEEAAAAGVSDVSSLTRSRGGRTP